MNECILALDLGTETGWAIRLNTGVIFTGTSKHIPHKSNQLMNRWSLFIAMLNKLADKGEIQVVYYEEVRRHLGTQAAHIYGGFKALLEQWCQERNIQMKGVGVGEIKKFWTGRGNAQKKDMEQEAERRGFIVKDDNEADALALLHYGMKEHG